ncbi:MAG: hypothetical protein QXX12_00460 [Nanopusillaceae archaeon]
MSRRKKIIYGILAFIGLLFIMMSFSEDQKTSSQKSKTSEQFSVSKEVKKGKEVRFYSLDNFTKLEEQITKQHSAFKVNSRTIKPEKVTGETRFVNAKIGKELLVIGLEPPSLNANISVIVNCEAEKIDCLVPERQKEIIAVFNTIFKTLAPSYTGNTASLFKAVFEEVKQSIKTKEMSYSKDHVAVGEELLMNINCLNICEASNLCKVSFCKFNLYPFNSYLQYYKDYYQEKSINVFELDAKGKLVEKMINL